MLRLLHVFSAVLAIAMTIEIQPAQAQFPFPAPVPVLKGHLPTYSVTARLSGGALRVDGSDATKDRNGNLVGEMIVISQSLVSTSRRVRIGRRYYTVRSATQMVRVHAGVDRNRDGTLRVLGDNPFPNGLVLQVPVRDVTTIQLNMGDGADRVTVAGVTAPVNALLDSGNDYFFATSCFNGTHVEGGSGNDEINVSDSGVATIDGGPGHDNIVGSVFDDVIYGRAGNDWIRALDGHDFIDAGDDNDEVQAGGGHDIVQGGLGADTIEGESGIDIMIGSMINIPAESWPSPDAAGIIFTTQELRELLFLLHVNDFAGDKIYDGAGDDFVVWYRYQDKIDIVDPFGLFEQFLFGVVARG